MRIFSRILLWMSNLKVAIVLLLVIAVASALGTAIPQGEQSQIYLDLYQEHPWLGLINGENLLRLQLDHVYSSSWFLILLIWIGLALMICSWRRQWPALKAAIKWIDYKEPRQISKLSIAKTIFIPDQSSGIKQLAIHLEQNGWQVKQNPGRLAARKGVIGRAGPPIVHIGLVLLMIGAILGSLGGNRLEQFIAPGNSFELINKEGINQLELVLENFQIDRDTAGRPEQFRSTIKVLEAGREQTQIKEVSVNHPLRIRGMTIYQADWSLEAITLQLGTNKPLQLPLTNFPELGEQIWGLVLPTNAEGTKRILITLSNERGPVQIFDENGKLLASLRPGGKSETIKGIPLKVIDVLTASGLLLKHDPGVPLVYTSFAITLIGGALSVLATRQIWAVEDPNQSAIHIGGLCNRNLSGLANDLPELITVFAKS